MRSVFLQAFLRVWEEAAPVEAVSRRRVVLVLPLPEVAVSGRLVDKLQQVGGQRLQQHADVRPAVGLQLLRCHGVQQRGLLPDGAGRRGLQHADFRVSRPEGDLTDSS